jgi:cyclohexa-1,5-dienecarbonyl-CoA hydratase
MSSAFEFIRLETAGGVATITLDRPPLNILTIATIRELCAALDAAGGHDHLHALVLRAAGKAFCAGVDVTDHVPDRVNEMIRGFGRLFTQLRAFPAPTISAVQGAALGGGMELALGCDLVLAAASARFGQPEITLGVFPPIAAALLPRLIGFQQAARLVLTGETVSAEDAARLGLVTFAVADDELSSKLDRLLDQFRGLSATALKLAKSALLLGTERGDTRALAPIEDLYLTDLMATSDAGEGIRAFMEKRPPVWSDA